LNIVSLFPILSAGTMKKKPLSITWYGHSAFLLADSTGRSVLIDPWLDNPKSPLRPRELPGVDLILVTHGHCDHIGNCLEISRRFDVPVIAIHELSLYLKANGVTGARGMNKGGTLLIGDVSVTMTHALHSADIDVATGSPPDAGGEAAGFVVGFSGHPSVYHAGDTTVFGDMKLIHDLYKPEIAILPIGGVYTMGPREASLAVSFLKPRWIVGMHYGTFPALTGTPGELRKLLPPSRKGSLVELVPGTPRDFA